MKTLIVEFVVLVFLVLIGCIGYSGDSIASANFHSLRTTDGLHSQVIRAIAQDQDGFIWLGTNVGLVRFDGQEKRLFEPDKNIKNSISDSILLSLLVTPDDNLWIATYRGGLNLFDKETQTFQSFQHDPENPSTIKSNNVISLASSSDDNIWVGTKSGLNLFSTGSKKVLPIEVKSENKAMLDMEITALLSTANEKLWIGTKNGVAILDSQSKTLTRIKLVKEQNAIIRAIIELENGNVLIGSESGLFHYDINDSSIARVGGLSNERIFSLTLDRLDSVWIGTASKGVYRVPYEELLSNSKKKNFRYDKGTSYSINNNTILSLITDYSGVVWIGTYSAGLNWIDPLALNFELTDDSINGLNCLESPIMYSTYIDKNETLWLGTRLGITRVDKAGECRNFMHTPDDFNSLSNNEIHDFFEGKDGTFWIATARGLNIFNPEKNIFNRLSGITPDIRVHDISELESGQLLISTLDGLHRENQSNNGFEKIDSGELGLKSEILEKIVKINEYEFLVGSKNGLLIYDSRINKLDYLRINGLPAYQEPITTALFDSKENIWVGSRESGLTRINRANKSVDSFNDISALADTRKFNALEEDGEDLWISTDKGLVKFNTKTNQARRYVYRDGLQGLAFNGRTLFKSASGEIFLGGFNGYNRFTPSTIVDNLSVPKVAFTKFFYFGEESSRHRVKKGFELPKEINQLKELKLSYKDYNFGFEFSALHFSDHKRNQYAYIMEGFDENWLYTDSSNRKVNYTNLPAGQYAFKVKAANKDGVWTKVPKELEITISPAPWLTWWAYSIYLITLISSIIILVKKRTQILEARSQQLENTVAERTHELSKEKHKVEQLLSRKNEELANVSHEFRTPLTLVLGPVAQLLEKASDKTSINKLNIVQRNGYRLLRMVDQLLNIETFRIKTIAKKSPQAIGKNTKLMCEAFADLADANEIKLTYNVEENINFEFTQDAYEKILLNLLSNAIKYSKSDSEITVSARRNKNNEYHLTVQDTGIGIPADKADSVFERYNRVMDENSEQVTGAGIGLALVKELVHAHQGRINLQSEVGEGTCIDIYLPIINEVSDEQVSTNSNADLIDLELVSLSNQKTNEFEHSETDIEDSIKESTVLVIEDNSDMRQYITNSLNDQYRVLTANNGKAGVELAITEVPDVIVSDIMMPVMDGYEATKAIRDNEITSHIPLVLLTARGDRESRLRGWNEKADEYLTKPFDVEELKIRLANLLEIRNLLKKKFAETIFVEKTVIEPTEEVEDQTDIYTNKQKQQRIFIDKLNDFLQKHYSETELTVPQIGKALLMGERQFSRKLKSIVDLTPVEYLRRYRLEQGKRLLRQGISSNRTAFDVGFSSQGYFGRCFKAQYGVSPSEYKKTLDS